jgi:hypothetical protein
MQRLQYIPSLKVAEHKCGFSNQAMWIMSSLHRHCSLQPDNQPAKHNISRLRGVANERTLCGYWPFNSSSHALTHTALRRAWILEECLESVCNSLHSAVNDKPSKRITLNRQCMNSRMLLQDIEYSLTQKTSIYREATILRGLGTPAH